jgi:aldehyde dehydrogenase (NAD+)
MAQLSFTEILDQQRRFFSTGATRSYAFRRKQLKILYDAMVKNEKRLADALYADLNKSRHESYSTEIGPVRSEIRFLLRHLREWMQPKRVPGMLFSFPSSGKIVHEPHGSVLILSAWNYPVWLLLVPAAGAISAGNCLLLKPSELTPHTSGTLSELFTELFPPEFVTVIQGGPETSGQLLELPPDYIFFTGSTAVGKIVAQAAAKNLVPFTLELGGKTPCVVDDTIDLHLAAKRILWGKLICAGQVCAAPDYLLVHENVKDRLIKAFEKTIRDFFPDGVFADTTYPCIISDRHFQRLRRLMEQGQIVLGGKWDEKKRKIEPTVIEHVNPADAIMQEEIFGPLLPVLTFKDPGEIPTIIRRQPHPLAIYIFSKDRKFQRRLLTEVSFGGALLNDTIEHLGNHYLPFGGLRSSGLGAYHGRFSFETFSHRKAVMSKATWPDLPYKYKPDSKIKDWVMRLFLR